MKTTTVETAERGRSPLGAYIRFLADGPHGNMIHSTVPPGMVGRACHFRTIDEYWYVLSGEGEVWRRAPYCQEGVTLLGIDVRDSADAARDFMNDRDITYPSIYDNPGRSLLALSGFPRSTVPSTIVLDRRHRVAAVFLTAIRVSELLPVVQRVAAEEPAPAGGGGT